jgi:2-amino-4-hydroxy-6-hydroxymethyldihydropteridine diphosphokinase
MPVVSVSSIYETEPVGVTDQPLFLNLALAAETDIGPHELLSLVKQIENEVGRTPTFRWGPRVVDIDILLYGDQVVEDQNLEIPHREMARRAFVLVPLAEIAGGQRHPTLGQSMRDLRDAAPGTETVRRLQTDQALP